MGRRIFYTASSKEEHERLERDMKRFLKSYSISTEGDVEVKTGFDNCVRISPITGQILEVQSDSSEIQSNKGRLERLTIQSKFAKVTLGETLYQINFDSSVTV